MKCVVVGDKDVGKTSVLLSYTKKAAGPQSVTIFVNLSLKLMVGKRVVSLNIWDTAGQDEVNRLRPLAYARTDVFLVVFAIDQPDSLSSVLKKWAPELQHHSDNSLVLLVGNKADLRDSKEAQARLMNEGQEMVCREEAVAVAKEIGARGYYECSARTMEGVKTVFDEAIQGVLDRKTNEKFRKKKSGCVLL